MVWFKRKNQGIFTDSKDKKDFPKVFGLSVLSVRLLYLEKNIMTILVFVEIVTITQEYQAKNIFPYYLTKVNISKSMNN